MRLSFVLVVPALASCVPAIDTGENGTGPIIVTPAGGLFIREGAAIEIPKGAVLRSTAISVSAVDSGMAEIAGRKRVSLGYRFSPTSLAFAQPVTISIPWLEDRVPPAVDPGTFDLRRQTPEQPYLALADASTMGALKVVQAPSDRLGLFWVTSPDKATGTSLVLSPEEANVRVGQPVQFSAQLKNATGDVLDVPLAFAIAPSRAASVDATGLVSTNGPGIATLTASAAGLAATAIVRIQGDTVGPTSFVHDNPFPTGNDLWGGAIAGGVAFFSGANGTVLSKSSGGAWTRHYSSPGAVLRAVAGSSPQNAVAIGTLGNLGLLVEVRDSPVVQTFDTIEPRALWFDGTYGMAVGYGNDVLLRKGGAWSTEYSPSVETLLSVVGDGHGAFTTVGSRGSIYQYEPGTGVWNSLYQTQLSVLLTAAALVGFDGSEAWAAGGNKLWHFSGNVWTALNLPATPALTELTALAQIDGRVALAGRADKQGFILIYSPRDAATDGGSAGPGEDGGAPLPSGWSVVALRGPQIVRGLFGAGSDGYAVGTLGAVWRYGGGSFTELSHGFYGDVTDVAVAGTAVVAVVNDCTSSTCATRLGSVVVRNAPGDWGLLAPPQPFTGVVNAVSARSATDVWVAADEGVFRCDGASWLAIPGGFAPQYLDITVCGAMVWALGPNGAVYRVENGTLAGMSVGVSTLHTLHCVTENQVWLAGEGVLYEKSGATDFAARSTPSVRQQTWRAVWSPGQGEAFAFGDARYGVYWNGDALSPIDAPGGILPTGFTGAWGSSVDNLYLVGSTVTPVELGYAVRFDGAFWRLVDSGSQRPATAIHGSSPTEIWLGTEGGGLLRAVP